MEVVLVNYIMEWREVILAALVTEVEGGLLPDWVFGVFDLSDHPIMS